MFGFAGNDTLMTEGGNDLLDGGTGADAMYGGDGDDTYIVDNTADETLGEYLSNGFDTVKASVSYRLSGGMEVLILMGTAANGTGNELNNILTGNAAANLLDGQNGADIMTGGNGSDTYVVDTLSDVVVETSAAGRYPTSSSAISPMSSAPMSKI
jgi:Ca2+-binding RTX toxin-like protein